MRVPVLTAKLTRRNGKDKPFSVTFSILFTTLACNVFKHIILSLSLQVSSPTVSSNQIALLLKQELWPLPTSISKKIALRINWPKYHQQSGLFCHRTAEKGMRKCECAITFVARSSILKVIIIHKRPC